LGVGGGRAAVGGGLPLVSASITPLFSRYFRNSSFFESGVYERGRAAPERDKGRTWYDMMLAARKPFSAALSKINR
jgi:hypothetical protein